MATLVLAAIGNALIPAAAATATTAAGYAYGAALGALAGGLLDNATIFKPPDQVGPRLDDLKLSSGAEGSAVWVAYGQENRIPCQIIWASDLIETAHDSGGKGGPDVTSYTYAVDIAISLGEAPPGGIDGCDKLWLNGQLFYDDTPNVSISSNLISIVKTTVVHYYIDLGALDGTGSGPSVDIIYEDLVSPSGGPDLSVFRSGINCTISGATNANNNGTFKVVSATKDEVTGISTLRVQNILAANQSASPTITIVQNPPKFSPNAARAVTFYNGSASQVADPLIESHEGTGNVPAFRGEAYVVIQGMQLRDLGNFLPQSIDAMIRRTAAAQSVGSAISDMVVAAGRATTEIDVTDLSAVTLKGYSTRGIQPTLQKFEPLALAFDLRSQEDQGILRLFRRQNATVVLVDEDQIVLDDDKSKIRFKDPFTGRLPNEVNITYIDPASDYQSGTAKERRAELSPATDNKLAIDLRVTMTAIEANATCKRFLWSAWGSRHTVEFRLPPSMLDVLENDIVRVNYKGIDFDFLVSQVTLGANGLLEIEAHTEETQTLTQTGVAQTGGASSGASSGVFFPPETIFIPMPLGPLREDEVNSGGFYWAGCYADISEIFFGATLYESRDGGTTYSAVELLPIESVIGFATTALGTVTNPYQWDRARTVTVKLSQGELESCTEIEALNGANMALLGGEVIHFATATLIGTNTYTLSNLIRGRVNTELARGLHAIGDSFTLLSEATLNFRPMTLSDYGATYIYKLVSQGGIVSDFNANSYLMRLQTLRHFAPCNLRGTRNVTNNDILISLTRRTRRPFKIFGEIAAPLDDTVESYRIDILNTAETLILRTFTVTGATSQNYLAADQTADGLTAGAAKHVRAYHISTLVGLSYPVTATI